MNRIHRLQGLCRAAGICCLVLQPLIASLQAAPEAGLVGYWSFDNDTLSETSGFTPTVDAPGFSLQRTAVLPGSWSNPGLPVIVEGKENVTYDSLGGATQFYRLRK